MLECLLLIRKMLSLRNILEMLLLVSVSVRFTTGHTAPPKRDLIDDQTGQGSYRQSTSLPTLHHPQTVRENSRPRSSLLTASAFRAPAMPPPPRRNPAVVVNPRPKVPQPRASHPSYLQQLYNQEGLQHRLPPAVNGVLVPSSFLPQVPEGWTPVAYCGSMNDPTYRLLWYQDGAVMKVLKHPLILNNKRSIWDPFPLVCTPPPHVAVTMCTQPAHAHRWASLQGAGTKRNYSQTDLTEPPTSSHHEKENVTPSIDLCRKKPKQTLSQGTKRTVTSRQYSADEIKEFGRVSALYTNPKTIKANLSFKISDKELKELLDRQILAFLK